MTRQLRKRHLQAWTVLAIALPAAIIIAYTSVKSEVTSTLLQPAATLPLPITIKKGFKENYTVALKTNDNRSLYQLEWINKKMLTVPTATIYQVTEPGDITNGKLIGRIEARGSYYFFVDSSFLETGKLVVYDFIHKQIIDSLKF